MNSHLAFVQYSEEVKEDSIKLPPGLLLYGPPGCSKTMIAKAAATESSMNFIAVRGAELLNMYVGETERAIRSLFKKARDASPSIIFFDEMEAIARTRDQDGHTGVDTVTTLLNELDGVTISKGVFVLGATNKPDQIDDALLRPGRLDQTLYVGLPDIEARRLLLNMECQNLRLGSVQLDQLAEKTEGMSGAEVVKLCQLANRLAFRKRIQTGERQYIEQEHFDHAFAKVGKGITEAKLKQYEDFASKYE